MMIVAKRQVAEYFIGFGRSADSYQRMQFSKVLTDRDIQFRCRRAKRQGVYCTTVQKIVTKQYFCNKIVQCGCILLLRYSQMNFGVRALHKPAAHLFLKLLLGLDLGSNIIIGQLNTGASERAVTLHLFQSCNLRR